MINFSAEKRIQGYRPDIDGLRALAVLLVVAYHAFPAAFKGGFIGVDIFFVISGFLICGIILAGLENGSFSIRGFYQRRICRLFPALITVLLATMIFGWLALLFPDEFETLGKHIAGGGGFVANLIIWSEVDYWDIAAKLKPLLHLWSLGIEEQFYIVAPCLLLIAWKKGIRLATLIVVMFIVSFILNFHYYENDPAWDFYAPYTRFWEILAGAALACASRHNSQYLRKTALRVNWFLARICTVKEIKNDGRFLQNILSIFGMALIFLAARFCRVDAGFPGVSALLPVFGAALVIAAGPQAWLNRFAFSNKLAVGIGLISYPLYLWHWPILSYLHILGWDTYGIWPWRLIRIGAVVAATALSIITYRYIESPIRFAKQKRNVKTAILLVIMAIIVASGLYIYKGNMPLKFADDDMLAPYSERVKYVIELSNKIMHSFDTEDNRKKLLIIGDSQGQDFLNMIHEADIFTDFQTRMIYIAATCQIDFTEGYLERMPEPERKKFNITLDGVNDYVRQADVIILASYWHNRILGTLSDTVTMLDIPPEAKLFIIGPKRITVNLRQYVKMSKAERAGQKTIRPLGVVQIGNQLGKIFPENYIDMYSLFCNSELNSCRLFTEIGDLMFYDDAHLTANGARYFGHKLATETPLRQYAGPVKDVTH